MFTLIFDLMRRRAGVIGGALLLAGCAQDAPPPPLKAVSLFQGDVVVAGPEGYCVDRDSVKQRAKGSFVLLASCESLSGKRGRNVPPAVMTVSVLPQSTTAVRPMPAELAGNMTPVKSVTRDDLSLVYLPAGGNVSVPGGDPKYWRGGMVLNGYTIGLAVYGLAGSSASGAVGKQLITGLAARLRRASPVRADTED